MFILPLLTNEYFLGGVIIVIFLLFGIHKIWGLGRVARMFSARRKQAYEAREARRDAEDARIAAEEAADKAAEAEAKITKKKKPAEAEA